MKIDPSTQNNFYGHQIIFKNLFQLYKKNKINLKVAAGYTILEMKFFRRFPPWFHKIIQTYNLRRLSISKFSTGMEYCGIAKDTGL